MSGVGWMVWQAVCAVAKKAEPPCMHTPRAHMFASSCTHTTGAKARGSSAPGAGGEIEIKRRSLRKKRGAELVRVRVPDAPTHARACSRRAHARTNAHAHKHTHTHTVDESNSAIPRYVHGDICTHTRAHTHSGRK